MTRYKEELREYANAQLMDEYNDLMIRIKTHLFDIGSEEFKKRYSKPSNEELDIMMYKVFHILKQDSKPMIRR